MSDPLTMDSSEVVWLPGHDSAEPYASIIDQLRDLDFNTSLGQAILAETPAPRWHLGSNAALPPTPKRPASSTAPREQSLISTPVQTQHSQGSRLGRTLEQAPPSIVCTRRLRASSMSEDSSANNMTTDSNPRSRTTSRHLPPSTASTRGLGPPGFGDDSAPIITSPNPRSNNVLEQPASAVSTGHIGPSDIGEDSAPITMPMNPNTLSSASTGGGGRSARAHSKSRRTSFSSNESSTGSQSVISITSDSTSHYTTPRASYLHQPPRSESESDAPQAPNTWDHRPSPSNEGPKNQKTSSQYPSLADYVPREISAANIPLQLMTPYSLSDGHARRRSSNNNTTGIPTTINLSLNLQQHQVEQEPLVLDPSNRTYSASAHTSRPPEPRVFSPMRVSASPELPPQPLLATRSSSRIPDEPAVEGNGSAPGSPMWEHKSMEASSRRNSRVFSRPTSSASSSALPMATFSPRVIPGLFNDPSELPREKPADFPLKIACAVYKRAHKVLGNVHWTISDAYRTISSPKYPKAELGHFHFHRNRVTDQVDVWIYLGHGKWDQITAVWARNVEQPVRHPDPNYSDYIADTHGENSWEPSFIKLATYRKRSHLWMGINHFPGQGNDEFEE